MSVLQMTSCSTDDRVQLKAKSRSSRARILAVYIYIYPWACIMRISMKTMVTLMIVVIMIVVVIMMILMIMIVLVIMMIISTDELRFGKALIFNWSDSNLFLAQRKPVKTCQTALDVCTVCDTSRSNPWPCECVILCVKYTLSILNSGNAKQ